MNDRDFLIWLHQRLVYAYNENANFDYMWKLRSIIDATPKDQITPIGSKTIEEIMNGAD